MELISENRVIRSFVFVIMLLSIITEKTLSKILFQRRVFVFHGLGISCSELGRIPVGHCIETGAGFFDSSDNILRQGEIGCAILKKEILDENGRVHQLYSNGFHLVGFSQGGLIVRAIFQICFEIRPYVKRILTFGTPHLGITAFPASCMISIGRACLEFFQSKEKREDKWSFYQYKVDPKQESESENDAINKSSESLIQNLLNNVMTEEGISRGLKIYDKLEAMINVMYTEDLMIYPVESSLFGITFNSETKKFTKFNPNEVSESVGIAELAEKGRLISCAIKAGHLGFESKLQSERIYRFVQDDHWVESSQDNIPENNLYDKQLESALKNEMAMTCSRPDDILDSRLII
jgi:hypothetical protein